MMAAALLASGIAALPAANERSWLHVPHESEVRLQVIRKQDREATWPFAAETGYLTCVYALGQKIVGFTPGVEALEFDGDDKTDDDPPLMFLSTNPVDLLVARMTQGALLAPMDGLEEMVRRIAPFVEMGKALCDQPQGAELSGGEL